MPQYHTDKPVTHEDDDFFRRYGFAKRVANSIKSQKNPDCVVFGINGAWGEGKTSILNFINKELSTSSDTICLKFNPWRYNGEDVLLMALFNSIAEKINSPSHYIKDKNKSLKNGLETIGDLLKDYGSALSYFSMGNAAEAVGKFLSTDIEVLKSRIEKQLENLGKRIVIFIDDIDRLDKNEIYSLLKIVKLTGDFSYLTYILSFDKEMVASAISERFGESGTAAGHNFLEKIIQVPLEIPKIPQFLLQKYCINLINLAINESEIPITQSECDRFANIFTSYITNRVTSPRLAVRYGNALRFVLPMMKGEVDYADLMLIEAIKVFYPEFYTFIKNNPSYFTLHTDFSIHVLGNETKEIKSIINNLSKNYSHKDKININSLLESLFFKIKNSGFIEDSFTMQLPLDERKEKRLDSSQYFDRYFTYSLQEGEISDAALDKVLSKLTQLTISNLSNELRTIIIQGSPEDFLTKIRLRQKTYNRKEAEKLSEALALIGNLFPSLDTSYINKSNSPLAQLSSFISSLIKNLHDEGFQISLVNKLIKSASSLEFAYLIYKQIAYHLNRREIYSVLGKTLVDRTLAEARGVPIFKDNPPVFAFYVLELWGKVDKNEMSNYVSKLLIEDRLRVVSLLSTIVNGSNFNGFYQTQYEWLSDFLDVDFINQTVLEILKNPKKATINEIKGDSKIILNQFISLHEQAVKQRNLENDNNS